MCILNKKIRVEGGRKCFLILACQQRKKKKFDKKNKVKF